VIPKSRDGNNHRDNIKALELHQHVDLHRFFGNALPHEQVNKLLNIADNAMHRELTNEIRKLFDVWGRDMYKEHCFKKKNGLYVPMDRHEI